MYYLVHLIGDLLHVDDLVNLLNLTGDTFSGVALPAFLAALSAVVVAVSLIAVAVSVVCDPFGCCLQNVVNMSWITDKVTDFVDITEKLSIKTSCIKKMHLKYLEFRLR